MQLPDASLVALLKCISTRASRGDIDALDAVVRHVKHASTAVRAAVAMAVGRLASRGDAVADVC